MPLPPPRISEHEVRIRDLDPRHDGVRIAQLSDIHVGATTPREHVRAAVAAANAAQPDLVVLTGDYVCWRRHEAAMVADQLARPDRARACSPCSATTTTSRGAPASPPRSSRTATRSSATRRRSPAINGAPLAMVGVDDPVTRHDDLDAAFAGRAAGVTTKVVLCHSPDPRPHARRARRRPRALRPHPRRPDLRQGHHRPGHEAARPQLPPRHVRRRRPHDDST